MAARKSGVPTGTVVAIKALPALVAELCHSVESFECRADKRIT